MIFPDAGGRVAESYLKLWELVSESIRNNSIHSGCDEAYYGNELKYLQSQHTQSLHTSAYIHNDRGWLSRSESFYGTINSRSAVRGVGTFKQMHIFKIHLCQEVELVMAAMLLSNTEFTWGSTESFSVK